MRNEGIALYSEGSSLTENEARSIAITEISESENGITNVTVETSNYNAEIKTFKGQTYWYIQMEVSIVNETGNSENRYYEISVDYYTGEVLEVAKNI